MDIICFCHLRWNFVYQRPQHLLSRLAQQHRVFVIEEPIFDAQTPFLENAVINENLCILVPHLPPDLSEEENYIRQQFLLKEWYQRIGIQNYVAWFYTPMAMPLAEVLPTAELIIYDCMDELSAFKNAPATIKVQEALLLKNADLVFTGGHSLYEAKKDLHPDIYPFPSSIDKNHFLKARTISSMPSEYQNIPTPRIGFFGVLDERFDTDLLQSIAAAKPEWHFVMIGPTVKIDPGVLPKSDNIHYLGGRSYEDLPMYLAGWEVALIPFALNESTRFISPTKTPEYLAGGVPVVSTSIRDVINPYGEQELIWIADTPEEFIQGIEWGIASRRDADWLKSVDIFLEDISWDITWLKMMVLIQKKMASKQSRKLIQSENEYV